MLQYKVDLRKVASNTLLQIAIANLLAPAQAKQLAGNLLPSALYVPCLTNSCVKSIDIHLVNPK